MILDKAKLPEGWRIVRLGDVAEVTFSTVDKKTIDGEFPVQLCNYTDVFYSRRIHPGMDFMSATASPVECERWVLKKGDVLFTKDSETPDEIGVLAYVSEALPNVLCGYHLGLARPQTEYVQGVFLAESLASRPTARQFARIANGVTRFGLTLSATRNLPILLPPLAEQRAIAAVLESIDDAIERTEAVIAATERLRDSLLHELLTRGLPGWHTKWKEAPGIGSIPADWQVVRLGDVAEVKGGKRLPKGASFADRDTGLPYIRVVDFSNRTVASRDVRFLHPEIHQAINRYKINSDDVYISIAGTIGLVGIIPVRFDGANLTENAAKIVIPNTHELAQYFLVSFLDSHAGQSQITRRVNTLGQPKLALALIKTIQLPLPSLPEQRAIAGLLDGVDKAIEQARVERNGLQALKWAASEALLTGRVRTFREMENCNA